MTVYRRNDLKRKIATSPGSKTRRARPWQRRIWKTRNTSGSRSWHWTRRKGHLDDRMDATILLLSAQSGETADRYLRRDHYDLARQSAGGEQKDQEAAPLSS